VRQLPVRYNLPAISCAANLIQTSPCVRLDNILAVYSAYVHGMHIGRSRPSIWGQPLPLLHPFPFPFLSPPRLKSS